LNKKLAVICSTLPNAYNAVGAVYLEPETERTLFNLLQFTTSRTDSD